MKIDILIPLNREEWVLRSKSEVVLWVAWKAIGKDILTKTVRINGTRLPLETKEVLNSRHDVVEMVQYISYWEITVYKFQ